MTDIPAGYLPVQGSILATVVGFRRSAELIDEDQMLEVTVRVRRRPDAPPLPDPGKLRMTPVKGREFMPRAEYARRYGAARGDISRVVKFATDHDLIISHDPYADDMIARRSVMLQGSRDRLNRAFAVDLGIYEDAVGWSRKRYLGREGSVFVPADLVKVIEGVFGLDERPIGQRRTQITTNLSPKQLLPTPSDIAALYNFPVKSAVGQCVALLEFGGGYLRQDIDTYFAELAGCQSPPKIVDVGIDGRSNSPCSDLVSDREVTLDIDVVGSVAPGAEIVVYFAPLTERGWIDATTACVHDAVRKPSVIAICWGCAELQSHATLAWTRSGIAALQATFQEAMMLGVTVLASSGDEGSSCGIGDGNAHVVYPASDPGVIACGGTFLCNTRTVPAYEALWTSGGGGISDIFQVPSWQLLAGLPLSVNTGRDGRGIPDISGYAYPGYTFVYAGCRYGAAGTSVTAPLYAALVARFNAALGTPIGSVLPNLYALAGTAAYRDITGGQSNASGWAPGYYTVPGWDACTGLGVVDGSQLLSLLTGPMPPPGSHI